MMACLIVVFGSSFPSSTKKNAVKVVPPLIKCSRSEHAYVQIVNKNKKKYLELEAHETLKRVASANAIIRHDKSSSLITVKRHAMVLSFFLKANLVH